MTNSFCFFLVLAMTCLGCSSRHNSEPNMLLIMCDDLGWLDVGFNGAKHISTPHLDRLASQGLIFNRFYSASPVCSPTRASCLTGRSPYRMGIPTANTGHLKKEEITLPELLKDQGYLTGHFGKWHLGTLTTQIKDANRGRPGDSSHYSIPSMHGYDQYFATESKVPTYDPMIKPVYFDTTIDESLRYGWQKVHVLKEELPYGTKYWTDVETYEQENLKGDNSKIIMDRAIPFLQKAIDVDQPFFASIWLHTPHLPVVTDSIHSMEYKNRTFQEQLYYGSITAMDEQIGRLMKMLERNEVDQDLMIWFCSDNGPERDTPGSAGTFRARKRSLYEGGVRVPAFLYWPKSVKPGVTDIPGITHDYLPTILDFLSIKYPKDRPLDGISLREIINRQVTRREQPIGFRFGSQLSWMTQDHKLISQDKGETFQLYNLITDPQEQSDIIQSKADLKDKMIIELQAWIQSCNRSEEGQDYY